MFSLGRFMVICRMVRSVFSSLYFDSSWIESQSQRKKKSARVCNRMRIGTSTRQKSVSKQMEISFFLFPLSSSSSLSVLWVVAYDLRCTAAISFFIYIFFFFFHSRTGEKSATWIVPLIQRQHNYEFSMNLASGFSCVCAPKRNPYILFIFLRFVSTSASSAFTICANIKCQPWRSWN